MMLKKKNNNLIKEKSFNLFEYRKKQYKVLINKFEINDFNFFMIKFLGIFIYRGKRSEAIKVLDFFLFNLKKKFKLNPYKVMFKIIKNLMPFLVTGLKTYKGRTFYVPLMVKGNKKNVFVIDWLVRLFKNYSNIWGVKKEDILKSLIDSFFFKGIAINIKKEQYYKALESKYNLKRRGYHKYLIKLYLKHKSRYNEKKFIKKKLKKLFIGKQWKWKAYYLKKRRDILNRKLYSYRNRYPKKAISYKGLFVK